MSDTEVGSIVAYLTLRREDWNAGVRATEEDSRRLGSLNPRIRIDSNTGEILAQLGLVHAAERKVGTSASEAKPFVMNLWAALAAVAPAAVPIGAVAGGALLGLLPVAATVMLGIKGIGNQMKSTALQGTQFATDVNALKGELSQLQTTAASGLMSGIDQALSSSQPLFGALNAEIGQTSTQLGDIVSGAAPALLAILTQLSPLISTIGDDLAAGAHQLEHWAQSSNGISTFVAYVQAQLPEVEQLLGGVITLVGHLFEASAGPGAALLHDLNLVVAALDAIPVGVLQTAIPLAVSLYAALKTGQAVSAAVRGVDTAVGKLGTTLGLTGPQAEVAAARVSAAVATEEAAQAERAAVEAESYAASQRAAMAWGAVADETAMQVAAAARAEAEALAATAAEAQAAAEQKIAAAGEAAAASAESSVAGAAGWTKMLGPLAAVGIGVTLLSTMLFHNSDASEAAAAAANNYAQSLKASTDALAQVNLKQTVDNLSKADALTKLQSLAKHNADLGVTFKDLTLAVNGTGAQYDEVVAKLQAVAQANVHSTTVGRGTTAGISDQTQKARDLIATLKANRDGLDAQTKRQLAYNAAMQQAQIIQDGGNAAVAQQAAALHTTSDAYLAAQQAAQKNTAQTKAQTLEMQLEDNAAGLLTQALQGLAGQNLSNAQAQTSMEQAILAAKKALKDNKGALSEHTQAGLDDRQAIEGAVSAIRAKMTAEAQATGSTAKATSQYRENAQSLLEQIGKLDGTRSAAYRYAQELLKIPPVVKTKADLDADAAKAQAQALVEYINGMRATIRVSTVTGTKQSDPRLRAADGGTVRGPGGPKGDQIPALLSDGEEVTPEPQASKHRALLKAIASDQVPGFASGGTAGRKGGKPTSSQLSSVDSAESALVAAAANMAATAASVRSAASSLDRAARSAGLSQAAIAAVAADQRRLSVDAARRQSVAARLGTAPSAPTAYDQLAAAQGQFSSDQAKYRDAAAGFDLTAVQPPAPVATTSSRQVGSATVTTTGPAVTPQLTAATLLGADQADVNTAKEFDTLIHKLVHEGMNADAVAQLAAKGPSAIDTARALAKSTPAQIRKFNSLDAQRNHTANDLGTFLAKQYDQAGVTAAKNLVAGLRSQEKTLTVEMERLADKMANAFSKRLGLPANRHVASGGGPLHPPVAVHVHAAPGHSAETIGRIAAAQVLFHTKR